MLIFLNSQPTSFYKELFPELFKIFITTFGSFIVSYVLFYKQNNKVDKEKAYDPIISNIFKPFHFSLERQLFHKPKTSKEIARLKAELKLARKEIIQDNISKFRILKLIIKISRLKDSLSRTIDLKQLYKTLKDLQQIIKQNKLEFYLNDFFLYYLEKILNIIENLDAKKISSKELHHLYYYYKQFSSQYLQELQRSRKSVGLKKRTLGYRQNFGLYTNKIIFYLKIYSIPIVIYFAILFANFKILKR